MNDLTVTQRAVRPISKTQHCTYCGEPVGGQHKATCVTVVRKVKLRAVIEYEVEVPASWDASLIEFARNDGSWCANNMLAELEESADQGCLCGMVEFTYLNHTSEAFVNEGGGTNDEQKSDGGSDAESDGL